MGKPVEPQRQNECWLQWAVELQSLAQAGLTYGRDAYDRERYERIREIAAEMVAHQTQLPVEKVRDLFCNETGYQTPKLDTRAAVFQDGRILLVRERDGRWSLPGEAGLEVTADRIIAVQDRAKHNLPRYAYGVCKIFVLCSLVGGQFRENLETTAAAYFSEEDLPPLSTEKNTEEQIQMCFAAHRARDWDVVFD